MASQFAETTSSSRVGSSTGKMPRRNSFSTLNSTFKITSEDKAVRQAKAQSGYVRMKYMYFPIFALVVDAFQFTLLPWNVSLKWPEPWENFMDQIARIIFFQWLDFDLGVGYEVCQYLLAFAMILATAVLLIPAQKLDLAVGAKVSAVIWFMVTMMQTVLFMPSAKFAASTFVCSRFEDALDEQCGSGRHIGLIIAGFISVSALYFSAMSFARSLFTPLEMAKRKYSKLILAQTSPNGTYCMVTVKLILAIVLIVCQEVITDEQTRNITVSSICLMCITMLLCGIAYLLPYKNQTTQSFVLALLCMCDVSNVMGLINAIVNSNASSTVAVAWALAVPLSWAAVFPLVKYRSLSHFKQVCLFAEQTKMLALNSVLQGALPEAFLDLLTTLSGPTKIETVDCQGLFLMTHQVQQLCAAMASNYNASFKTLNLAGNKIGGVGHGIDLVIRKSDTLLELNIGDNELPPGIPVLCLALSKNNTLKKLNLSNCKLNARAGDNLAKALKENTCLEELNLSKNNLCKEGAIVLSVGLAENMSLKKLDVSWNQMGTEGLKSILSSMGDVEITMICNGVPVADWDGLKAIRTAAAADEVPGPSLDDLFTALGVTSIYALIGKVLNLDPDVALHALCEEFYLRLVCDPMLTPFFARVSMGRMRNLQRTCLTEALGGPKVYKGMDLKSGHAHLKIDDDHYDATIAHLFGAVLHFIPAPPASVVKALVDLTEALRALVVNTALKMHSVPDANAIASGSACDDAVDGSKAQPFFTGAMWKTGAFAKRDKNATHPALDVKEDYGGCCPYASAAMRGSKQGGSKAISPSLEACAA